MRKAHLKMFSAALVIAAIALPGMAHAGEETDYALYPSFHFFDVDQRAGRKAAPARPAAEAVAVAVKLPETSGGNRVFVVEQPLGEFLILAGRRGGVRVTVASGVRGTIRNASLPASMDGMLTELAAQFDFVWFRDGAGYSVAPAKDAVSRVIQLGRVAFADLKTSLTEAGLSTDGYELSYVESSNSVLVKGPAALVAKIELIAEAQVKRNSGVRLIRRGREG